MRLRTRLAINTLVCGASFAAAGTFLGFAGLVGWIIGLCAAGFAVAVGMLK